LEPAGLCTCPARGQTGVNAATKPHHSHNTPTVYHKNCGKLCFSCGSSVVKTRSKPCPIPWKIGVIDTKNVVEKRV